MSIIDLEGVRNLEEKLTLEKSGKELSSQVEAISLTS
jgi:hypothetical protein